MARISRRRLILVGGAVAVGGLFAVRFGVPWLVRPRGGLLSDDAAEWAEACFGGIDRSQMLDCHAHIVGIGAGGTGCWVNPELRSQLNPIKRFQFDTYRAAVGLENPETADADYVRRLLSLHRQMNPDGRLLALAFDMHVGEDGTEHPDTSSFYTPNDYVLRLAARHKEIVPCVSIHPYRVDAVDRLDAAAEAGARAVKWLPNAMGIDPASPLCDPFYRRLVELDLPIITHGGREYAVESSHQQGFGNPLRLRRPLDAGVRLVVAHCASFGTLDDFDAPNGENRQAAAFDLFMRLFAETQYEKNLFADISGLTLINRSSRVLRELLVAEEFHHRLLNGSDYPIPALHILFSTLKLQWAGFLDERERTLANEIAPVNPLLFDFVVKRSLRVEKEGKTYRFPDRVFETEWFFN